MGLNYLKLAQEIAKASKDPRYQVGAIVFDRNGNIRSTGYNGAPRGVMDDKIRYEKPLKQFFIAHAEENAIVQAARTGISLDDCCMLIWGKMPCAACTRMIIQAGIKSVLFQVTDWQTSAYRDSFLVSRQMFKEANIKITHLGAENV